VTISNLLSSDAVTAYVNELMEAFELQDIKGSLKNVTLEVPQSE